MRVPAAPSRSAHWRLTDRGIALVLVAGLLIATAAIAVVTLTAVRVTGDRYHHPTPNVVSAGQQGGRTA